MKCGAAQEELSEQCYRILILHIFPHFLIYFIKRALGLLARRFILAHHLLELKLEVIVN